MLKILFILHLPPPLHGPAVLGEYIKQSELINSQFECCFLNLSLSSSINDIGATNFTKFFRYLKLIWDVKKQLIFNRPDLCYLTLYSWGPGFYKDSLIALIVKLFRVKTVYHLHNKGLAEHRVNHFENLLYKMVFRNSEVILISERLYYDIERFVPQNLVHYCTNGIPDSKERLQASDDGQQAIYDPAPRTPHPAPDSYRDINILFFSNLIESKGLFTLLEACNLLKEKGVDFKCLIAGSEGDISVPLLDSWINAMGLSKHAEYLGVKAGAAKNEIFSRADIFVHPTYFDCLPLVVLEAMQHSLPVVATAEGAIPDAVEDEITGFIVQKKDPIALAQKIEILINNPLKRIEMGSAGRRKYEMKFTLEKFEMRMAEILSGIQ